VQLLRLANRAHSPWLSSLIVMGGYVLSRLTGLLREVAISQAFGTSAELGAYQAAFRVTDLLYMVIIGGALGSSFIPVFLQVWNNEAPARAWRLASAVITWALGLLALASVVLWLLAPTLAVWLYSGQDVRAETLELTAGLMRLFLFSPLLLGLGGLAMAALNAHDRFTLPALAPAAYNLGIIGGALFLAPTWGIWGLAWGVVIGAAVYLLVQLPGLWHLGMRLTLTLGRDVPELLTIARQMAPRVFGQAASQISLLVTAILTTRLAAGMQRLAGLSYAYQLMLLPYGIFSLSLSTVAFPRLARLFAADEHAELAASVRRTLSMILFLTLPATAALLLLAVPLVRLLFQRNAFDDVSLAYTVAPLLGYATVLPAFAASEILIRSFYAMQQTRTPVLVGLLQVGLNMALGTLALERGYGTTALALAFSVANNIEALLLAWLLARQLPGLWRDAALWRSVRAALLSTLLLALLLWLVWWGSALWLPWLRLDGAYSWQRDLPGLLLWLTLVGGAGGAIYLGLTHLFGGREAANIWARVRRR
jgi:putative peptidoglycan lipid II flippase